jgi:phenylacetate-CoA ligase
MSQDRRYYNEKMERMLQSKEMADLQCAKIRKQVRYVYENSPYYRSRFEEAGVEPDDIRTLEDFRRRIPLFDKKAHQASQMESFVTQGHGFGTHLCVKPEQIRLVGATSGTTGEPTFYTFTDKDLGVVYESVARGLWRMGARPGDRIVHAFALGMFAAGVPLVQALEHFGALAIPAGMNLGTEKVVLMSRIGGASGILSTPSFIEHMIEKARDSMGIDVRDLGFKRIMVGGEPGAGLPEVRRKIEGAFQCPLYDLIGVVWGIMGCSCDCEEYQGMHFLTEDLAYIEVIDPESGEPLPLEEGVEGTAVITALEWEAGPPIRYSIGDVVRVHTAPCPCGKSGYRMRVIGRSDDMLKVKGVIVYPAAIRSVLEQFVPRITSEFRIVLEAPPPRVIPPLKLKLEQGRDTPAEALPVLAEEIRTAMHNRLQCTPEIRFVPYRSLPRSEHKTNYFEKLYE